MPKAAWNYISSSSMLGARNDWLTRLSDGCRRKESSDTLDAHTTIASQLYFGFKKIMAFRSHSAVIQKSVSTSGNFLDCSEKKRKLRLIARHIWKNSHLWREAI